MAELGQSVSILEEFEDDIEGKLEALQQEIIVLKEQNIDLQCHLSEALNKCKCNINRPTL